jgi:hypothetical protein
MDDYKMNLLHRNLITVSSEYGMSEETGEQNNSRPIGGRNAIPLRWAGFPTLYLQLTETSLLLGPRASACQGCDHDVASIRFTVHFRC